MSRRRTRTTLGHYRPDGKPKRAFATREEAERVANRQTDGQAAYRCIVCESFHVGHPPRGAR